MKKFSKKITEATCIFCGAPLTSDDRCNYCGCEYITQKAIEEILYDIPNLIEFDVITLDVQHITDISPLHFKGACFAVMKPMLNPEIKFTLIHNDVTYIRQVFQAYTNYDYKLNFGKHTILAYNAIMTTFMHEINDHSNKIHITLLPDKVITS